MVSKEEIIEVIIQELAWDLVNSNETITGAMAETNSFGYFNFHHNNVSGYQYGIRIRQNNDRSNITNNKVN